MNIKNKKTRKKTWNLARAWLVTRTWLVIRTWLTRAANKLTRSMQIYHGKRRLAWRQHWSERIGHCFCRIYQLSYNTFTQRDQTKNLQLCLFHCTSTKETRRTTEWFSFKTWSVCWFCYLLFPPLHMPMKITTRPCTTLRTTKSK